MSPISSSYIVYAPLLVLCAPLIGSFTLLAFLTSFLALIVISIRLGFLAVEFSGGFALDFIKRFISKLSPGENAYNKTTMSTIEIKDPFNNNKSRKNHKHHLKQSSTKSPRTSLLLESTKSSKFYNPSSYRKNFVSKDDYFMMSTMFTKNKRLSRRVGNDYFL